MAAVQIALCWPSAMTGTGAPRSAASKPRIKAANFPRDKNANINPATIHTLATWDWIRKGSPLCLIGGLTMRVKTISSLQVH
ncbi:MAG: family ATPase [Arthrobacter sp.]|nr:family ATPase [Arthrobacter sp.]